MRSRLFPVICLLGLTSSVGCSSDGGETTSGEDTNQLDVITDTAETGESDAPESDAPESDAPESDVAIDTPGGEDTTSDVAMDEAPPVNSPIAGCPDDFSGRSLTIHSLIGTYDTVRDDPDDPIEDALTTVWSLRGPPGHSHELYDASDEPYPAEGGLEATFFASVVGEYSFVLTVTNRFGSDTCETTFTAQSPDVLQIEMFWNREDPCSAEGDTEPDLDDCSDVDLYLHRAPESDDNWRYFRPSSGRSGDPWSDLDWPNPSVCSWQGCTTCAYPSTEQPA